MVRSRPLCHNCLTQPHAAYAALTNGLASKWTFLSRTVDNICDLLQPLEDCLRQHLIPNLTGRSPPGDQERAMLDLPPRHGGLGTLKTAKAEYKSSLQVTAPLITKITKQDEEIGDILEDLSRQKKKAKKTRQNLHKVIASQLKTELTD